MTTKLKYRLQSQNKHELFRLTLSPEAFALALLNSGEIAGFSAMARNDGQWDVFVAASVGHKLNKQRKDGEHLTNVVERILSAKGGV